VVADPPAGRIESSSDNDTIPGATPLPMTETPPGSGFFTALGTGTFFDGNDRDYWRFDAEAGDRVTVRLETGGGTGILPFLHLRNASNQNLQTVSGNSAGAPIQIQNVTIPGPGSYYVYVGASNATTYQFRIDHARGPQLEVEANDSQAAATLVMLTGTGSVSEAQVAGALVAGDTAGDYFRLNTLNTGNTIHLSLHLPPFSSLSTEDVRLTIQQQGSGTALATSTNGSLSYVAAADAVYYARVEGLANAGLRAQYLLGIQVTDTVAPRVTATTLPDEGATSMALIDRFSVTFSEDMAPGSINSTDHFDLRAAGGDGLFGTQDDQVYTVAADGYTSGLTASFRVADGPLQPGSYRLTASSGITDRAGNALDPVFVRSFALAALSPFVIENRANDTFATATPLGMPQLASDGSFTRVSSQAVGSNPYYVSTTDLDGDGNLDLVTANYSSNTVSVLRGNGDGTFQPASHLATGSNPIAVAIGDVNGDGRPDIVSANYIANTVSVLLQNADGTFAAKVDYAVGNRPRGIRLADINGDGKLDVITANESANNISVLLGTGGGNLASRVDYATGSGPQGLFIADLDGDGHLDVVTANVNAHTVGVLKGSGDGTFQPVVAYSTGASTNPRDVAVADLNGDGIRT
jgi:hypothetical protein